MTKKINTENWSKNSSEKILKNEENLLRMRDEINSIGPGFCLAKFTQVTMHLGTGLVHSCHHPKAHKIPTEGLEQEPSRLFNTAILKTARKEMLSGKKPTECDYCWRVEKNNNLSDRVYKSAEDWAFPYYEKIANSTGEEIFKPTYLEVSFGNACNLNCVYCGPEFSSKWVEELKQKGPIVVKDHKGNEQWAQGWQDLDSLSIPNKDYNPYIESFWKWFPEIYDNLIHYRITGGEPLLNKNTMRSLDYLIENPRDNLELGINTNLSIPEKIWNQFLKKLDVLENDCNFKKITIFTSIESWGKPAEYGRSGLDVELLINRFEYLLKNTNVRCVIMSAYNMLAITSFQEMLKWVLSLKKQYNSEGNFRIGIDIPYLRHPEFLDVQYCSDDLLESYINPCLEFLKQNVADPSIDGYHKGFEKYEYKKFERIVENRRSFNNEELKKANRSKFYEYINSIDERRNQNFLETFPEMLDFYNMCMKEKQ
jgi:hypothetical protein